MSAPVRTAWVDATLAPMVDPDDWGIVEDGAVVTEGERIVWVGRRQDLPDGDEVQLRSCGGGLLTPGLIDCHTHLVYAGDRAHEAERRWQGATYAEIAAAGGGIQATVAATRAAVDDTLLTLALARARTLMAHGVTTLEAKSGYGLSLAHERRCLTVARGLAERLPISVHTTFLGAHALPPGTPNTATARAAYAAEVASWVGVLVDEGLVDSVDAFCEHLAFSVEEVQCVFEAATRAGVPVRLHAEQLSNSHGAAMAARYGALSCDHLEYLDEAGVAAMAAAGTVAVLLPGAYYLLRETQRPPVAALRAAGVPMAVATDHNPGTSPTLSPLLMAHMACVFFGLTPIEALHGLTVHAARALGMRDRGQLAAGMRADFAVWDVQHPRELLYGFGTNPCRFVVARGQRVGTRA